MVIDGQPHARSGRRPPPACNTWHYSDGDTIVIEPFRSGSFPVVGRFDRRPQRVRQGHPVRRLRLGEHRVGPGGQRQRAVPKAHRRPAFAAANCIGCGLRGGLPQRLGIAVPGAKLTHR
ncbi:hypothetical protein HBB16_03415 [Pseudonocardia sp. MCCB 268]|nr:hypothetical protein [Pseudonocardia cytotoxica]